MRLADERRGSRHERGYTDEWAAYARAYRRDHPLCADPYHLHGELGVFVEVVDHIVPPWAGGDFWDPSNHQPLCTACNLRKAADDRRRFAPHPPQGGSECFELVVSAPACDNDTHSGKLNQTGGSV